MAIKLIENRQTLPKLVNPLKLEVIAWSFAIQVSEVRLYSMFKLEKNSMYACAVFFLIFIKCSPILSKC